MYSIIQLVEKVRRAVEQPGLGYFTLLDFVDAINEAQEHHVDLINQASRESYFEISIDLSLFAGQNYVELPENFIRIGTGVQILQAPGQPFARKGVIENGIIRAANASDTDSFGSSGGQIYFYALSGNNLFLYPGPAGDVTGGIRLFYIPHIYPMIMGRTSTDGNPDGSTIMLPNTSDPDRGQWPAVPEAGAYIGYTLGLASDQSQDIGMVISMAPRKITAFRDDNLEATISPVAPAQIVAGWPVYFYPRLPKPWHNLLAVYAAMVLRGEKDEQWEALDRRYERIRSSFLSGIEDREGVPGEVAPFDPAYGMVD